ncbi:MAG: class I SAM-dependent methyltransferase [Gammaproteobacteria bacterium]|nr:class I SAM-dependent methyltransferase [Gammaproteobacteria bacterium]
MSLKFSYTILAPFYDALIRQATAHWRQHSLALIDVNKHQNILINGIGSGLDIPYLPEGPSYTGTDITPAMLSRAASRRDLSSCEIHLQQADSQCLPFDDNSFDLVIMHLILAVVPEPELALKEASRILKPGGRIHIFDKFLKPGQLAPCRRFINLFSRHIATRTDVVLESLLAKETALTLIHQQPALAKGWFRFILLEKKHD